MNLEALPYLGGIVSFFSMILSAFSGGGGSLILLMSLLGFTESSYLAALTLSKIAAAVVTGTASFLHIKKDKYKLDKKVLGVMFFGSLFGISIATYLVQYQLDESFVISLLPFIMFSIGLYLIWNKKKGLGMEKPKPVTKRLLGEIFAFFFLTNIINGLSGGFGIIFGSFMVIHMRISFIHAIAYGMVSGFLVHLMQSIYLTTVVDLNYTLAIFIIIGAFLGGYVGTKLQSLKGNLWVKNVALLVMFGIGIRMLIF